MTVPLLLNSKLPASVTVYNTWSTKALKHCSSDEQHFLHITLQRQIEVGMLAIILVQDLLSSNLLSKNKNT
jgi:hypothetical protein